MILSSLISSAFGSSTSYFLALSTSSWSSSSSRESSISESLAYLSLSFFSFCFLDFFFLLFFLSTLDFFFLGESSSLFLSFLCFLFFSTGDSSSFLDFFLDALFLLFGFFLEDVELLDRLGETCLLSSS